MIDSDAATADLLRRAKAALRNDGCTCDPILAIAQRRHRADCPLADKAVRN